MPDPNTEAEAIADLARAASYPVRDPLDLDPEGDVRAVFTRGHDGSEDLQVFDSRALRHQPPRSFGTIIVTTAASFIQAVKTRALPEYEPVVYADEATMSLVAVLNDDHGGSPQDPSNHAEVTGHRDYRLVLGLARTPEWERWLELDDKMLGQEKFADHVERSLRDIVDPEAAKVLELAQTLEGTTTVEWAGGTNIVNSARTVQWVEKVEGRGGREGNLAIPEKLQLGLRPFYGSVTRKPLPDGQEPGDDPQPWIDALFPIDAGLRYRVNQGNITIGYRLDQPHEVERRAWSLIAENIGEGLGLTAIAGPPPPVATLTPLSGLRA